MQIASSAGVSYRRAELTAEHHIQVAEFAVEMKCKELALDQFDDTLRAEKGFGFDDLRTSAEEGIRTVNLE